MWKENINFVHPIETNANKKQINKNKGSKSLVLKKHSGFIEKYIDRVYYNARATTMYT